MTIQEAIKSGKPFKRAPWVNELRIRSQEFAPFCHFLVRLDYVDKDETFELAVEDILADDWEVAH